MSDQEYALAALEVCRHAVIAARESAKLASTGPAGARKARAKELAEKLADCIAFVERLSFVCIADAASAAHEARVAGGKGMADQRY